MLIGGRPGHRLNRDIVAAGALGDHARSGPAADRSISPSSGIGACSWNRSVPASGHSEICSRHRTLVEAMPGVAAEARQHHIGHDGANAERLARKVDRRARGARSCGRHRRRPDSARVRSVRLPCAARRAVTPLSSCSKSDQLAAEFRPRGRARAGARASRLRSGIAAPSAADVIGLGGRRTPDAR